MSGCNSTTYQRASHRSVSPAVTCHHRSSSSILLTLLMLIINYFLNSKTKIYTLSMKLEMGICTLYFHCYLAFLSFINKDTKERIKGKKRGQGICNYLFACYFHESPALVPCSGSESWLPHSQNQLHQDLTKV